MIYNSRGNSFQKRPADENANMNKIEECTSLNMAEKLKAAVPYYLFFNKVLMSPETHKQLNCIEMKGY